MFFLFFLNAVIFFEDVPKDAVMALDGTLLSPLYLKLSIFPELRPKNYPKMSPFLGSAGFSMISSFFDFFAITPPQKSSKFCEILTQAQSSVILIIKFFFVLLSIMLGCEIFCKFCRVNRARSESLFSKATIYNIIIAFEFDTPKSSAPHKAVTHSNRGSSYRLFFKYIHSVLSFFIRFSRPNETAAVSKMCRIFFLGFFGPRDSYSNETYHENL